MESIAAVQQRIAAIEARFPVARTAGATAGPAGPTPAGPSFQSAFAAAVEERTAEGLTPAKRLAPGQYGRLEPPPELARYGNGRIPASAMTSIGVGNHRLWDPAAKAITKLMADARRDGITIGVTDSYRDFAGQERVAAAKGLHSEGGLAARPGTSNHGWGLSVDLDLDRKAQAWMDDNAHRYGFVEDVTREPWHWTYRPA